MATYNGAEYIEEQLRSLSGQTFYPAELVIGDDGSTDETIEILERFRADASFPVRIIRHRRKLGFADNFLQSASTAKSKWVAFCDQDDVWLPQKLEQSWLRLREADDDLKMVVQGTRLVDSELRPLPQRGLIRKRAKLTRRLGQHGFWVHPGFCQTIKTELLHSIPFNLRPPGGVDGACIAHDRWTCILANVLGQVAFTPGVGSIWRRHEKSVMVSAAADQQASDAARGVSRNEQYYTELMALATAATDFAVSLQRTAAKVSDNIAAGHLDEAASRYEDLADVKVNRAEIYRKHARTQRASQMMEVLRKGGYFGSPFVREGKRDMLRDLRTCINK